jgi:hypothetical protein
VVGATRKKVEKLKDQNKKEMLLGYVSEWVVLVLKSRL